ncbi:MAG: hypothetical protein KKA79_07210 [Nanoarchaeota archaeon]|nr:hypothetical protein [Nanoarchaeota archaeon]MCG2718991.1 hypothetical protein [Nanoarchaeota archaeon]
MGKLADILEITIPIVAGGGMLALLSLGANYIAYHNDSYHGYSSKYVSKIDGIMSYTKFEEDGWRKEYILSKHSLFLSTYQYTDGGYRTCDGKVDKIEIETGMFTFMFSDDKEIFRHKHYDEYKELFDEADKILAKEKIRFKDYFDLELTNPVVPELPEVKEW